MKKTWLCVLLFLVLGLIAMAAGACASSSSSSGGAKPVVDDDDDDDSTDDDDDSIDDDDNDNDDNDSADDDDDDDDDNDDDNDSADDDDDNDDDNDTADDDDDNDDDNDDDTTCGSTTCADGCCTANGVCQPNATVCGGTNGTACVLCLGDCNSGQCNTAVWTDSTTGYIWQNGPSVGTTGMEEGGAVAQTYCASLNWGGYSSGWHLPDIDQLRSLIRGCAATETCTPTSDTCCGVTDSCASCWNNPCGGCTAYEGPNSGEYTPAAVTGAGGIYWSATADGAPLADSVDFDNAYVEGLDAGSFYGVRCVRNTADDDDDNDTADDDDDNDTAADDDDTSETVWTDSATGYMWQNGPTVGSTPLPWEGGATNAQTYCAGLTWAGETGWHLPSIDELRTLIPDACPAMETNGSCTLTDSCASLSCVVVSCLGCAAYDGGGNGGDYTPAALIGAGGYYWSATTPSDGTAWCLDFDNAALGDRPPTNAYGVRCVRASADDDDDNDDDNDDDSSSFF